MPVWLVVVVAIGIAVGVALVLRVRRPRSIEDELSRTTPGTVGSSVASAEPTLAARMQTLARNRATGKLEVTSGNQACSLYFLFGYLFHAEYGSIEGDDALQAALAWPQPTIVFDPKAHMPTKETILRPPA